MKYEFNNIDIDTINKIIKDTKVTHFEYIGSIIVVETEEDLKKVVKDKELLKIIEEAEV